MRVDQKSQEVHASKSGREPTNSESGTRADGAAANGLSQVAGKVFEQLSLSSWFPAAVLVGNAAVLIQMHTDRDPSVGAAVQALTAKPLGILIVVLFALVIATVVTQAFEYATIQVLEGYDWARGPGRFLLAACIRRHHAKWSSLVDRTVRLRETAFEQARAAMADELDSAVLEVIERRVYGNPVGDLDIDMVAQAKSINWLIYLPAEVRYQMHDLEYRLRAYPEPSRLMPTRLGNRMRAAEDTLVLGEGENLAGYVMRHQDRLPATIRHEHHTYRARLDMYCSLVPVFVVLAAGSAAALHTVAGLPVLLAVAAGYLVAGRVAYEAAVASAEGWADAVQEIGRLVEQERAQPRQPATAEVRPSALGRLRAWLHPDVGV